MAPRLSGYFCGPHLYLHNNIDPTAESVCIICREPFTDERVIRLTRCNHIVGADCFRDWVRHHPDTCPYWNHTLHRTTSSMSLLEWACNHRWFKFYEELVHMLVTSVGNGGPNFIAALNALHGDRLSIRDFATVLWYFWYRAAYVAAAVIIVVILVTALTSITLYTITTLPPTIMSGGEFCAWIPFAVYLNFFKVVGILITSVGVLAATAFLTVVFAVLVLSVWRSLLPHNWAGKQLGVRAWSKSVDRREG